MLVFDVGTERVFDPVRHVEKVLGTVDGGDVTIACWEPGQVSPNHLHPNATEIYFCFEGGGVMRTPEGSVVVTPGSFVVHPPGELHEIREWPGPHGPVSSALRAGFFDADKGLAEQSKLASTCGGYCTFRWRIVAGPTCIERIRVGSTFMARIGSLGCRMLRAAFRSCEQERSMRLRAGGGG